MANEVTMRFNLRFLLLYLMPWVAIVASVRSYPGNLSLDITCTWNCHSWANDWDNKDPWK